MITIDSSCFDDSVLQDLQHAPAPETEVLHIAAVAIGGTDGYVRMEQWQGLGSSLPFQAIDSALCWQLTGVFKLQYLCKKPSLSGLDRQIFGIFFLWGFVSVLIGGIVGGSVLTALNPSIVSQPSKLHSPTILLHHLCSSSFQLIPCCMLPRR